jgi:hypothetical protein
LAVDHDLADRQQPYRPVTDRFDEAIQMVASPQWEVHRRAQSLPV